MHQTEKKDSWCTSRGPHALKLANVTTNPCLMWPYYISYVIKSRTQLLRSLRLLWLGQGRGLYKVQGGGGDLSAAPGPKQASPPPPPRRVPSPPPAPAKRSCTLPLRRVPAPANCTTIHNSNWRRCVRRRCIGRPRPMHKSHDHNPIGGHGQEHTDLGEGSAPPPPPKRGAPLHTLSTSCPLQTCRAAFFTHPYLPLPSLLHRRWIRGTVVPCLSPPTSM